MPFRLNLADIGWMATFNYPVMARLRDGATIERARAELDVIHQHIVAITRRETPDTTALRGRITPLDDAIVGRARRELVLLPYWFNNEGRSVLVRVRAPRRLRQYVT